MQLRREARFVNQPGGKMAPKRAPQAATDDEETTDGASKKSSKTYTNKALAAQARFLAERRKLRQAAVDWCREHGKGSKAAVKSGLFPGVTRNMIQTALVAKKSVCIRDHHNQILTNEERHKLASWLLACADGNSPKDRDMRRGRSVRVRECVTAAADGSAIPHSAVAGEASTSSTAAGDKRRREDEGN